MNANQVKVSVETAKEVMNDKALKTKGDKDRRLREKKEQNTKKFMQERKTVQIKQGREKEKLKASHEKQVADLDGNINAVMLHNFTLKTVFFLISYDHKNKIIDKLNIFLPNQSLISRVGDAYLFSYFFTNVSSSFFFLVADNTYKIIVLLQTIEMYKNEAIHLDMSSKTEFFV